MITRTDLQYTYSWTTISGDNPKVSGSPDNTELNRHEGYEMLYFINKCAELWKWNANSKQSCIRLERIIKEEVPSSTRTQRGIKAWIEEHYTQI